MIKGQKMPQELKKRMIKTLIKVFSYRAKPINQYSKDGSFVTTWNSLMEIERIVGRRRSHIRDVCIGKRKSAYNFVWKYVDNFNYNFDKGEK